MNLFRHPGVFNKRFSNINIWRPMIVSQYINFWRPRLHLRSQSFIMCKHFPCHSLICKTAVDNENGKEKCFRFTNSCLEMISFWNFDIVYYLRFVWLFLTIQNVAILLLMF